jgi:predicted ATPase
MDEAWRVDWANECVWHGREIVRLPPKVFAVLRLLVAQTGQLVTKEVLLQAVWPETVVSEAVLTTCIGELRKALGETAQAPRFIQTVHRRGYRFIGHLPTGIPSALLLCSPHPAPAPPPLLVGREGVLAHLWQWLAHVQQGARQVVWLTGEPGIGKTTVVNAFVESAAAEGDVWLGWGQCIEHYGVGEAYLPVLEALGRLCRAPEGAAILPVLERQAPTWLAQMPGLLSTAAFEALQRRVLGATQERMLRELAEAVEALTVTRPLLLVLEDLHWSDYATMDLLTYLARRPGPSRLLLLGTYRPVEVLLRGHPLKTVKQELVLHGQGVELPLELLTAAEVVQYLALRGAGGAELPPALRGLAQLLYQRTDGHPLSLVTPVEHLLHRGVLRARAGAWEVQPEAAAALREVPVSARQMIEQQFDRLSPEEQRVLEAASVAGSAYAVAAVAAGLELAIEAVEDCCASLAQRGQFLEASGLETWPDGTVTERYDWQHALHQEVVYARVPVGRCLRLHRRIGAREETGYGAQASAHAAELAMHFERGRDWQRAVHYLQRAAENALRRYAYAEAIAHCTRGREVLQSLPDTPERTRQELALQLALGQALFAIKGQGAPEVAQAYQRARTLCQQVEETAQLGPVLVGLRMWYSARAEFPVARELSERLLHLAQQVQEPALLLEAHRSMGVTWFFQGELARARTHLEQGIALATASPAPVPPGDRLASAPWMPPVVGCHVYAALVLWALGSADQALQRGQEALTWAQRLAHPVSEATVRHLLSILHMFRGEGPAAQQQAEVSLRLLSEHDVADRAAQPRIQRAAALVLQGQTAAGIAQLTEGLAATRAIGDVVFMPYFLSLLAAAYGHAGQPYAGLEVLAEAHALVEQSGERWSQAELHRLQGELLLRQAVPDATQAAACFQQALAIARRQQAKSWELRAAMSLSRLWQQQGQQAEARALLAPIYGWFTEGFDTADLQEARALPEALI